MSRSSFAVIAHRGCSSSAPENTIVAFDLALRLVPCFELDVQLTQDGVVVVLHDEKLGRTNNGSGLVREAAWAAISQLDAGSWFGPEHAGCPVPMLREVLERFRGRAHIHLELKSQQPELAQAVKEELAGSGWLADLPGRPDVPTSGMVCDGPATSGADSAPPSPVERLTCLPGLTITSFHLEQLEHSIQILPGIPHGWLIQEISEGTLQAAKSAGVRQLCPRVDACSKALVDMALEWGFDSVRGWGVKTTDLLRHAVACGMHGATVNWPGEALQLLT